MDVFAAAGDASRASGDALRAVLAAAVEGLPVEDREERRRAVEAGEVDPGVMFDGTDEEGFLVFSWAGKVLCTVHPDLLDSSAQSDLN